MKKAKIMQNEYIEQLLKDRYYLSTETSWEQLAKRVSSIYPESYEYIRDQIFIPSTPTLLNANTNERKGTLSSCFTMGIDDSIEGIFDSLKDCAIVTKNSGGIGLDFSVLRSSNEIVGTINRRSSGPIPFMRMFDAMLDGIQQGGVRRGAGMGMLDINHPDIIEFIKIKSDPTELNRMNLSIRVSDDFYKKLIAEPDSPHKVFNRVNGQLYDLQDNKGNVVSVGRLWKKIMHYAWLTGDPGIFNSTIAYDRCANTNLGNIVISNPCQPAWAKLLTRSGIVEMRDVKEGDEIWSREGWTKVIKKWSTGMKKVYKYSTSFGIFYGTEEHQVLSNGIKKQVKEVESIDLLIGVYDCCKPDIDVQDVVDGLIIGDGMVHKASNNLVLLNIGKNDSDYFDSEIKSYIGEQYFASDCTYKITTTIGAEELPQTFERQVPERYIKNRKKMLGFLRGLYTANGSVCGGRVTLKAASLKIIEDVQLMLNSVGIKSYYTTNKPQMVKFDNGEYLCKQSYDLNIVRDREKFVALIGFIQKYKNEKLNNVIIGMKRHPKERYKTSAIQSVSFVSEEEVFDITVDNASHTYWTQGCEVSNCAEFVNIFWVSCSLGSFNLLKFVDDTGFNWDAYRKAIRMAVNFLNAVIDKNFYPIKKIEEVTLKTRPIGLGVMGFADLLYALKIPYNSQEAIALGDELIRFETVVGMQTSVELAKRDGSYPSYDQKTFFNASKRFFNTKCRDVDVSVLKEDIKKYGIRNSAITSIAPCGSIATIAEVSSSIEPVFALSYTRKVEKLNGKYDKMYIVDKVFEKCLDEKYSDKKEKILAEVAENKGSCKDCKLMTAEDRQLFITANDMSIDEHLNVLAAVANATSLSVSKTCNLPRDAKESDISDVYLKAWKLGIIGLTIYRDGSKEGILTTDSKEERKIDHIVKTHAPKRPRELSCDIHHVKVAKKLDKIRQLEYIVAVGLLYGDPYEIFVFENGKLASKNDTGILIKTARGKYDILLSTGERCVDIMKEQTEEEECVTRMASTALRHGADIHFVVHQLEKVKGDVLGTFTKVMARVLKKYIKEGVKVTGEVCPECEKKGEKGDLVRKAGCVHCQQCFWSKCG